MANKKRTLKTLKKLISGITDKNNGDNDCCSEDESSEYFEEDELSEDEEPTQKKIKPNPKKPKLTITLCYNKNCDHKKHKDKEQWATDNPITIKTITTINDLIKLGECYHCKMRKEFNGINLNNISMVKDSLLELNEMIGLTKIKSQIVKNIITFLSNKSLSSKNMLHSVILGPPGCGKTTFVEILAKIYKNIGLLKSGHIIKGDRSNMIGKYVGHTAIKTKDKIKEAYGGILLIDEVYQFGSKDNDDIFAKECVDTLNQQLSEIVTNDDIETDDWTGEQLTKEDRFFICFIVGYKDAVEHTFFAQNEGLKRRFPFQYEIESYNTEELTKILLKKINDSNLYENKFDMDGLKKLMSQNHQYFKNQGGDIQTLFLKISINQLVRVFMLPIDEKKHLLLEDIKLAIEETVDYVKKNTWQPPFGLYT